MLRKLYDWTLNLAAHHNARWVLAGVSFAESSFFPIPPDVLLLPMAIARRTKAYMLAAICTAASVLGGVFGYAIGYFLFESIGGAVLDFYGGHEAFAAFQESYEEWGIWIVMAAGLTPFPYKVVTIASGVMGLNLPIFILGSILSRGARFFLVAALVKAYGAPIQAFVERYLPWVATAFFVLLLGGFALIKYL